MKKALGISGIVLLLLCGTAISGCAVNAPACREYKIFCGMTSKHGEVTDEAWARFCDRYVSTAFPDGYTVVDAAGYWRSGPEATAKERSKVILIVAPADAGGKVRALARRYREEFAQECVLISVSDAEMELVSGK